MKPVKSIGRSGAPGGGGGSLVRSRRQVGAERRDRDARPGADREHLGGAGRGRGEAGEVELDAGGAAVDGGDEVEAQLGEVGQLLARERVGHQVGDDQADAAEAAERAADAGELRQAEAVRVAEDDRLDLTAAGR